MGKDCASFVFPALFTSVLIALSSCEEGKAPEVKVPKKKAVLELSEVPAPR